MESPAIAKLELTFTSADTLCATINALCVFNGRTPHRGVSTSKNGRAVHGNFEKLTLKLQGPARNIAAAMADPAVAATLAY